MTIFARLILLALATSLAEADSFAGLTYSSSEESASSIIDSFLAQEVGEGSAETTAATTTSTIAGFDATSTGTSTVAADASDNIETLQQGQSICATSYSDAENKLCLGSNLITCRDVRQCPVGEACFENVACEFAAEEATASFASGSENNSEVTEEGDTFDSLTAPDEQWAGEVSHFVMLGTDSEGETMMFMSEPLPQSHGGSGGGSSSSSSSSSSSGVGSSGASSEGSGLSGESSQGSLMSEPIPSTSSSSGSSSSGLGGSSNSNSGSQTADPPSESASTSEMTAMSETFSTPSTNESIESSSTSATTIATQVEQTFTTIAETIDNSLFLYETPLSDWIPSTVYRFDGFFAGLQVMHSVGVAGKKLYLGANSPEDDFEGNGEYVEMENCEWCFMYGLVNVAAFLAQAMKETIRYDACDENSWDRVGSMEMYPISNSCGQLGQSYQDYHCSEEEKHMECAVDPEMTITAVTHAKWWGAPGPLMCGPKSLYPQTGYWDYAYECNNPWATPPESCDVYEDQKAGKAINDEPYPNSAGRTDVEGCCWWGRGVIQTSGVCNFGKLNFYLGKRAFLEGRDSRYPDIDFCKDPEIICTSEEHNELKWIAGFFYWIDQVQPYDSDGWNYLTELKKFVHGGMVGEEFINAVSGIVNRGCHNPPCGTGDLDGGPERAENFFSILKALDFSFVDAPPWTEPEAEAPPVVTTTSVPEVGPTSPAQVSDTITYACGDGSQSIDGSPPSINIEFDYEIHSDLDVAVSQALEEVKQSILTDVGTKLGCTETSSRRLQKSGGNVIGLKSSRSDGPDPDAAGCLVEVDINDPAVCTPTKGRLIVFAEPGTTEKDLQSINKNIESTIQESTENGNYESNTVKRVTWIGDRDLKLKQLNPPRPVAIQSEPEPETDMGWMKIALYSLAGTCAFLLCLLCMIIPSSRRRRVDDDEELAMAEYLNAHREQSYRGQTMTPKSAIERRSAHLRAVQQGIRPNPHALENGTATSESDEDEDDCHRPSMNRRDSRRDNLHGHHQILAIQGPPHQHTQRREQPRKNSTVDLHREALGLNSPPPVQTIGDTGQFYVQEQPYDVGDLIVPPNIDQSERSFPSIEYRPQRGGGVESEDSTSSSEEEKQHRGPPVRRHSSTENRNGDRRPMRSRETRHSISGRTNGMTKEERQRRIEKARSARR